jgi:peptide-methionine (S)-S-oxide reductase
MTVQSDKLLLPDPQRALPGRNQSMPLENRHYVSGRPIQPPFPELGDDYQSVIFGMGCFWGAERKFWNLPEVYTTAVGYIAGYTPNPNYEEVCTGRTGHNEVVLVVYQKQKITLEELLKVFFESHDPTQGMRQGNDLGTQYRSGIYCSNDADLKVAQDMLERYQQQLADANLTTITTEVVRAPEFYYAEQYHQQYLAKNPNGYCGIGGTGVLCEI